MRPALLALLLLACSCAPLGHPVVRANNPRLPCVWSEADAVYPGLPSCRSSFKTETEVEVELMWCEGQDGLRVPCSEWISLDPTTAGVNGTWP